MTFDIAGFHQAMIYGPGTTLDDIDVPPFPPENILINEDEGLLASSPIPFGGFKGPGRRTPTRSRNLDATSSCAMSRRTSYSGRCTAG